MPCNSRCAAFLVGKTAAIASTTGSPLGSGPRVFRCASRCAGSQAMCRSSVIQHPSALCLRGVRAQTRALKFDGRRRDSARGTGRAAWRGLGLQAQLAAASVGLARRRRRRRRRLARLRVRIAHWGRGEGVGDELPESAITRAAPVRVSCSAAQFTAQLAAICDRCTLLWGEHRATGLCAHTS